jgi:hypothetical protein
MNETRRRYDDLTEEGSLVYTDQIVGLFDDDFPELDDEDADSDFTAICLRGVDCRR